MATFKHNFIKSNLNFKQVSEATEDNNLESSPTEAPKTRASSGLDVYLRTKASDFMELNLNGVGNILGRLNALKKLCAKDTNAAKLVDSLDILSKHITKNRTGNNALFPSKTINIDGVNKYSFSDLVDSIKTSYEDIKSNIEVTSLKEKIESFIDFLKPYVELLNLEFTAKTSKSEFKKRKNKIKKSHNKMVMNIPPENPGDTTKSEPNIADFESASRDFKADLESINTFIGVLGERVARFLQKRNSDAYGFFTNKVTDVATTVDRVKACLYLLDDADFNKAISNDTLTNIIKKSEKQGFTNSITSIVSGGKNSIFLNQDLKDFFSKLNTIKQDKLHSSEVRVIKELPNVIKDLVSLQLPNLSMSSVTFNNIVDNLYYSLISAFGTPQDIAMFEKIPSEKAGKKEFLTRDAKAVVEKEVERLSYVRQSGGRTTASSALNNPVPNIFASQISSILNIRPKEGSVSEINLIFKNLANVFSPLSSESLGSDVKSIGELLTSDLSSDEIKDKLFSSFRSILSRIGFPEVANEFHINSDARAAAATSKIKNAVPISFESKKALLKVRDAILALTDDDLKHISSIINNLDTLKQYKDLVYTKNLVSSEDISNVLSEINKLIEVVNSTANQAEAAEVEDELISIRHNISSKGIINVSTLDEIEEVVYDLISLSTENPQAFQPIEDQLAAIKILLDAPESSAIESKKTQVQDSFIEVISNLNKYKIDNGISSNVSRNTGFDLMLLPYKASIEFAAKNDSEKSRESRREKIEKLQKEGEDLSKEVKSDFNPELASVSKELKKKYEAQRMAKVLLPGGLLSGNDVFISKDELKKLSAESLSQLESKAKKLYISIYNAIKNSDLLNIITKQGVKPDGSQVSELELESDILKLMASPGGPIDQFHAITLRPSEIPSSISGDATDPGKLDTLGPQKILMYYKPLAEKFKDDISKEVLNRLGVSEPSEEEIKNKTTEIKQHLISFEGVNKFLQNGGDNADVVKQVIWELIRFEALQTIPAVNAFTSIVTDSITTGAILSEVNIIPSVSEALVDPKTVAFINLVTSLKSFDNIDNFILSTEGFQTDIITYLLDVSRYPAILNQDSSVALCTKAFILTELLQAISKSNLTQSLDKSVIKIFEDEQQNNEVNKIWKDAIISPIKHDFDSSGTLKQELDFTKDVLKSSIKGHGNVIKAVDMFGELKHTIQVNTENEESLNSTIFALGFNGLHVIMDSNTTPKHVSEFLSSFGKDATTLANRLSNSLQILESGLSYAVARQVLLTNKVSTEMIQSLDDNNSGFLASFKASGGKTKQYNRVPSGIENIKNTYLTAFIKEFNFLFSNFKYKQADELSSKDETEFSNTFARNRSEVLYSPEIPKALLGIVKLHSTAMPYSPEFASKMAKEILSGKAQSEDAKKLIKQIQSRNAALEKQMLPSSTLFAKEGDKFKLLIPSQFKVHAPIDITKESMLGQVFGQEKIKSNPPISDIVGAITRTSMMKSNQEVTSMAKFYRGISDSNKPLIQLLDAVSGLWGDEVHKQIMDYGTNVEVACANILKALNSIVSDGKDMINDPASQKTAIDWLRTIKTPLIPVSNPFSFTEYKAVPEGSEDALEINENSKYTIRPSLKVMDQSSGKSVPYFNSDDIIVKWYNVVSQVFPGMNHEQFLNRCRELYTGVTQTDEVVEPSDVAQADEPAEDTTEAFNLDNVLLQISNTFRLPGMLASKSKKSIDDLINSLVNYIQVTDDQNKKNNIYNKIAASLTWLVPNFLKSVNEYNNSNNEQDASIIMNTKIRPVLDNKNAILTLASIIPDNNKQRNYVDASLKEPEHKSFTTNQTPVQEAIGEKKDTLTPDLMFLLSRYKNRYKSDNFDDVMQAIVEDLKKFLLFYIYDSSEQFLNYKKARSVSGNRCLLVSTNLDANKRIETAISCGNIQMIVDFVSDEDFNKGDTEYYRVVTKE